MIALRDPDVLAYMSMVGAAMAVVTDGVSRSGMHCRVGVGHPPAQGLVRAERHALKRRANILAGKLDTLSDQELSELVALRAEA